MQKTQAPDIIFSCNNKKAYIPYLYLNGRGFFFITRKNNTGLCGKKKTKYV